MKSRLTILSIALCFLFVAIALYFTYSVSEDVKEPEEHITIAILAKDKALTLPLYLACLERQTWPADKTNLYIRTNNNTDNTAQILRDWIAKVSDRYAVIYFDDTDVPQQIQKYGQHEWNIERLKVLGKIRQDSVQWAFDHHSHYFVADCDNFIVPETIERMHNCQLPIVAPLLICKDSDYSNYHAEVDEIGYFRDSPFYIPILRQQIKGLIELPVVHCTYFIRNEVLNKMCYDDHSDRYEYVIFSDNARRRQIPQYLDNRKIYGILTFAESAEEIAKEGLKEFVQQYLGFSFIHS